MVRCSHLFKNFPQFVMIHTVKGFSAVNETEIDVFLEFSCFFYDPMDVGNYKWCFYINLGLSITIIKKCNQCLYIAFVLCLLAILWKSAFGCLYLSFSPLLLAAFLFTAFCKASQTAILLLCISFSWGCS